MPKSWSDSTCRFRLPSACRCPTGSYYITDLAGCEVREAPVSSTLGAASGEPGALIGRVRDVQMTGEGVAGTPILVVDSPRGELLIPLAQDICVRVDTRRVKSKWYSLKVSAI